jgi:hypothetical protein
MAFKKVTTNETPSENKDQPSGLEGRFAVLRKAVEDAYSHGVSIEDAERMAAQTLSAQLDIAAALATADLDSRMKKNGMKTMKAKVYMEEIGKHDKKPSEGFLDQAVALDQTVAAATDMYEQADAYKEELTLYFGIFKDAHIFFRGISKGNYA